MQYPLTLLPAEHHRGIRQAGHDRHGLRLPALIAVLSRHAMNRRSARAERDQRRRCPGALLTHRGKDRSEISTLSDPGAGQPSQPPRPSRCDGPAARRPRRAAVASSFPGDQPNKPRSSSVRHLNVRPATRGGLVGALRDRCGLIVALVSRVRSSPPLFATVGACWSYGRRQFA